MRRLSITSVVLVATAAVLVSAATPAPAQAQLTVCNKTPSRVFIAVAYLKEGRMTSRGWFTADPGECVVPVGSALLQRYYYLRAESEDNRSWGDDYSFCTKHVRYEIPARVNCATNGYDEESFFQVDTRSSTSWTQNLVLRDDSRPSASLDGIRFGWRESLLDPATKVMQVSSSRSYSTSLQLRCYTNDGYWKSLYTSVPANGYAEVGVLEGWPGNFVSGERCQVLQGGTVVHEIRAP